MSSARIATGTSANRSKLTFKHYEEKVTEESESESQIDLHKLKFFYASLFSTILEDSITQIRILCETNNEFRIIKTKADIISLLAKKYSIASGLPIDELESIDTNNLDKEEYKLNKLAADRKLVYDIVLVTYMDLSLNRHFDSLLKQIAETVNRNKYRESLLGTEAKSKNTCRQLGKQLRVQHNHVTTTIYDLGVTINKLKSLVQDSSQIAATRERYVVGWEVARTEQHLQRIKDKESSPLETIRQSKVKLEGEQRSHTEIELLLNILINEKMEEVEKMMTKYDEDTEQLDLKIQTKRSAHLTEIDKREAKEKMYALHAKEITEWVHFKDEREKARLFREKMNHAATVAQAWWRGLMVRLELGPFKPKRPNQKAKK